MSKTFPKGRLVACAPLLLGSALLLGGASQAAAASCSKESLQTDPASVIEPCTALLATGTLSPAERAEAHYVRGRGLHRTRRIKQALPDYDKAIELVPTESDFYVDRSNIFMRFGPIEQSFADLEKALELNPRNAHALTMVGWIHQHSGDPEEALNYFQQALDADPREGFALLFRSQLYTAQDRYAEALKDLDTLIAVPPEILNGQGYVDEFGKGRDFHIMARVARAEIYEALGQDSRAEQELNDAVIYKWAPEALSARANFLKYKKGRAAEALRDLDEAIRLEPDNAWTHYLRGGTLAMLGRGEDAFKAYDQAITVYPSFGQAYHKRAYLLRALGKTDEAVENFERAMTLNPRLVPDAVRAFSMRGYWKINDIPPDMTPAFRDALRACMLDPECN